MTTTNGSISPVRIYFLGSGRIGGPILAALRNDPRIEVVGVGSQPPKKGKRGEITVTNLAKKAEALGFQVQSYENVNTPEFLQNLQELKIELLVVVAFGQILRRDLLELPSCGCLNVHASLLPKYRGASPVEAAILNGDPETGVAFMKMEAGLDTGPVYRTYVTNITPQDTTDLLKERLGDLAAQHAADVIWKIAREKLQPVPQDDALATKVGKLGNFEGLVDWNQEAARIERMVRAFLTHPTTFFYVKANDSDNLKKALWRIIIRRATVEPHTLAPGEVPGTILPDPEDPAEQAERQRRGEKRLSELHQGIRILCGKDILKITKLLADGRATEMTGIGFLNGRTLRATQILDAQPLVPKLLDQLREEAAERKRRNAAANPKISST